MVGRVPQLVASLADFLARVEDAVHRADRAEVPALVQQCRVDLGRSLVDERFAVQHVEDLLPLFVAQRPWRRGPWRGRWLGRRRRFGRPRLTMSIERRSRHAQRLASRCRADVRSEFFDGVHGSLPLPSGGGRGIPRISESFFWTSMIISAWRSLAASRRVSRMSRWFSAIRGASGLAFRPRRLGVRPASVPWSRWCRHVLSNDEYRPSRRSRRRAGLARSSDRPPGERGACTPQ